MIVPTHVTMTQLEQSVYSLCFGVFVKLCTRAPWVFFFSVFVFFPLASLWSLMLRNLSLI